MTARSTHQSYPQYAKIIHLGLAVFGVAAYLTAELAEDGYDTYGYLIHAYLGISLAAFIVIRILVGLNRNNPLSFHQWTLWSKQQWLTAIDDIRMIVRFELPHRHNHEGLAGIVQALGLMVFAWMAFTGIALFFAEGLPSSDIFDELEDLHEVGEQLVPAYLGLHVGAVIFHSVKGDPVWQKMFRRR